MGDSCSAGRGVDASSLGPVLIEMVGSMTLQQVGPREGLGAYLPHPLDSNDGRGTERAAYVAGESLPEGVSRNMSLWVVSQGDQGALAQ